MTQAPIIHIVNSPAPVPQPRVAPNTIPGFENMSFEQQRLAQDQLAQQRKAR